jgi:hypothetical protein
MNPQDNIEKKEIPLPNGNNALLVYASLGTPADQILKALDIKQPKPVILIIGNEIDLRESPVRKILNFILKYSSMTRLVQLFSRGIAKAASDTGAVIIDGGTHEGVSELMGKGVADREWRSVLLGVAPEGKVTADVAKETGDKMILDFNHSHFLLVKGNDPDCETRLMFEVAKVLAGGIPVITILVNGGDKAQKEVLLSVRQGWPIFIIEKTGGLADEIAKLWKRKNERFSFIPNYLRFPRFIKNPANAEIIEDGDIHLFRLDGSIEDFKADLKGWINSYLNPDPVLKMAWERFAVYDLNALRQQKSFNRLQLSILSLGVITTFLALTQTWYKNYLINSDLLYKDYIINFNLSNMFYIIILVLPIIISILVAAANRFKAGNKWVLLRASAEAIKRRIYCYRTRTEILSDQHYLFSWKKVPGDDDMNLKNFLRKELGIEWAENAKITASNDGKSLHISKDNEFADITLDECKENAMLKISDGRSYNLRVREESEELKVYHQNASRETILTSRIEDISRKLMQTDVNLSALNPYKGQIPPKMYGAASNDNGFSCLTPDEYLKIRLGDQLSYYQLKTNKLEKQLKFLQLSIYIFGGIGTFLAAMNWQLWIALTTTLVGTFTTYIEYQMVENTLMKYNQAATDLANIKGWWISLPTKEKEDQKNIDKLVEHTERILQTELTGWVQQMEDALIELREKEEKEVATKQPSNS